MIWFVTAGLVVLLACSVIINCGYSKEREEIDDNFRKLKLELSNCVKRKRYYFREANDLRVCLTELRTRAAPMADFIKSHGLSSEFDKFLSEKSELQKELYRTSEELKSLKEKVKNMEQEK